MNMTSADTAGNDSAVAIGGPANNAVNEHDSAQVEEQASDTQQATSSENAATDATGQQQTPNADGFVADQYSLRFRGKTIVPKSREELITWAQYGYNNTKRNQDLTERENALKEKEAKYGQVAQLSDLFEQNPQFKQAVYDIYHKFQSGQIPQANQQQQQDGQVDIEGHPVVRQLREKLEKMEQGYQTWEEKQATDSVEKEVAGLKDAHKDEDWTTPDAETGETLEIEVLKHADKNGFKTLEDAYRSLRWDEMQTRIKAQALKEAEAAKAQQNRAGVVARGGSAQQGTQQKTIPRSATYDQIAKEALASLK